MPAVLVRWRVVARRTERTRETYLGDIYAQLRATGTRLAENKWPDYARYRLVRALRKRPAGFPGGAR